MAVLLEPPTSGWLGAREAPLLDRMAGGQGESGLNGAQCLSRRYLFVPFHVGVPAFSPVFELPWGESSLQKVPGGGCVLAKPGAAETRQINKGAWKAEGADTPSQVTNNKN